MKIVTATEALDRAEKAEAEVATLKQAAKPRILDAIKLESKGTYALQLTEEISEADRAALSEQLHDIYKINGINFVILPAFLKLVTKEQ